MQACTSPRLMTGLYLMLSNPKVKDVKDRLQNILEREGEQPEVVVHVGTNDVGKKWKEVLQRCCIIGCHSTATILWRSTKSSSYPHSGEGKTALPIDNHLPEYFLDHIQDVLDIFSTWITRCTVENVLTDCIMAWFGNLNTQKQKRLEKVLEIAQSFTSNDFPSLHPSKRSTRSTATKKGADIIKDPYHPGHTFILLLP
ncbi:uncharacterized protein LOC144593977 isoform X2 [Rhinoraja longicauda]